MSACPVTFPKTIKARVTPAMKAGLAENARHQEVSLSHIVRRALRDYLPKAEAAQLARRLAQ